jgi:hypothetical protein
LDVLVLADRIAFDLFFGLDDITCDGVDHLPLEAVTGRAVEGVEPDFLSRGGGGVDRDGSGDEGA